MVELDLRLNDNQGKFSFYSSEKVLTTPVKHTLRDCCIRHRLSIYNFSFDQKPSLREDIEFTLVEFAL